MGNLQGFWSYVHADDQAEGERISRLAKDVASQFEMLTGEPLALFLDMDAIKWGELSRDKIDASLASVAFFMGVIAPLPKSYATRCPHCASFAMSTWVAGRGFDAKYR